MNYVFILGAGRSGTKIFRDCLGAAKDVSAIPYDVGYVWRYGSDGLPHDEINVSAATTETSEFLKATLEKLADKSSKDNNYSTILEKSVPNVLRAAYMNQMFPKARFIHLVRNGYSVVDSAHRNWLSPEDTGYFLDKMRYVPLKNFRYVLWSILDRVKGRIFPNKQRFWGPRYEGIDLDIANLKLLEVCAKQWSKCVDSCDNQLSSIDESRVLHVSFDEFVHNGTGLQEICNFAGIEDSAAVQKFFDENVKVHRLEKNIPKFNRDELEMIESFAGDTLNRYGFKLPKSG